MRIKNFKPTMEPGGRRSQVDKLGYVKAETRIKSLMRAGVRFAAAGAELYDGLEETDAPPWRSRDFDIADGAQYLRQLAKRKDEIMARQRQAKRDRDALAAQEAHRAQHEEQGSRDPSGPSRGQQGQSPAGGDQPRQEGSGDPSGPRQGGTRGR